jgi:hypothetical protein
MARQRAITPRGVSRDRVKNGRVTTSLRVPATARSAQPPFSLQRKANRAQLELRRLARKRELGQRIAATPRPKTN